MDEKAETMCIQRTSQAFLPDVPPLPDFLAEMSGKSELGSSAKEKAEHDARWLGDFCDDLTVAIALRKWDRAVALMEEGKPNIVCSLDCVRVDNMLQARPGWRACLSLAQSLRRSNPCSPRHCYNRSRRRVTGSPRSCA